MTLRNRLILLYSGLLAVIIVLFSTMLYGVTRWTLVNSVDTTLVQTVEQVIANSRPFVVSEFGDPSLRLSLAELDFFRASGVVVQVWEINEGEAPRLAGSSNNLPDYTEPLDPLRLHFEDIHYHPLSEPQADHFSNVLLNGEDWRVLARPIRVWNERKIVIQTAAPFNTVNQATRALLVLMVVSTTAALIGSMALGMGLSDRALAPIETITQAAAGIVAKDDLKTRLPWSGPMDELGRLTSVFNQMMERLDSLFTVQHRFVADVSHELRTPLTAIIGFAGLLGERETLGERERHYVHRIDEAGRVLLHIVNDLLDVSRIEHGTLILETAPFNVDALVAEVFDQIAAEAGDKGLTLAADIADAPLAFEGDAMRLHQVLLNLVGNAVKFTRHGGVTVRARITGSLLTLEVEDTGPGIEPAFLARLFDRFSQADASMTRAHGGLGLGLAISKGLVEAMGGTLDADSEPGKGTSFRIELPRPPGTEQDPSAPV